MATIWMFSGQGSQYAGMGRDLYDGDAWFRRELDACGALVRPVLGRHLADIVFEPGAGRSAAMARLRHSHPALFAVQYSLARTLLARGLKPDIVLGYSLGEVVALAVADCLDRNDALESLMRQAEAIEQRCPSGGMLAVMEPPEQVRQEPHLFRGAHVAGENFERHFVLAGTADTLDRIERDLTDRSAIVHRLPIDYPFHSPLIDPLQPEVRRCTAHLRLAPGACAVVSSCRGGAPAGTGPDYWWDLLRQPVRFRQTIATLERDGPHRYVDLGPSGTLAGFVRYNAAKHPLSEALAVMTPFGGASSVLARLA